MKCAVKNYEVRRGETVFALSTGMVEKMFGPYTLYLILFEALAQIFEMRAPERLESS